MIAGLGCAAALSGALLIRNQLAALKSFRRLQPLLAVDFA
jgi:hypothetical protein